ncbi:hypothetical protein KAR91_55340 [Candidatus Pacearchaeota archaeon]|nr:hypothetical protein [Candidatus Pacearchaeota archaeon]
MFKTDTDDQIKKYNRRLRRIGEVGIPLAVAGTLNHLAFESRRLSIRTFKRRRIIRSNWTQRGMLFQKTRSGIPIRQMESRSGNTREYADILERGGTVKAKNRFLAIPALGARISKSKRKRIAKRFRMPQLSRLRRLPSISGSPTRRFAAMLNIARKEKYFGPFLVTKQDAGGDRLPHGIFNLSGHGRARRGGGTITMLRKLQKSAHVEGRPFIGPAGRRVGGQMDRIYIKQASRVLRKFGRDIK